MIYGLRDPRTQDIRYVGITARTLKRRLSDHVSKARLGDRTHKAAWVRSLLRAGLLPEIFLIEESIDPRRELYWVAYYRGIGCDLTNGTAGGDGLPAPTDNVREKISAAARRRMSQPEYRERIARSNRERITTDETRAKHRARMLRLMSDPDARARISERHSGKVLSQETRANIGDAMRGRTLDKATCDRLSLSKRMLREPELAELAKARAAVRTPRVSQCKHGHLYTEENTFINLRGIRECRTCLRRRASARHRATKSKETQCDA